MTMLRWEPLGDAAQLREHLNRLIEQSLQGVARGGREPASARVWAPVVDILESADAPIVQAELAGIDLESVGIPLARDVLTLGSRRRRRPDGGRRAAVGGIPPPRPLRRRAVEQARFGLLTRQPGPYCGPAIRQAGMPYPCKLRRASAGDRTSVP